MAGFADGFNQGSAVISRGLNLRDERARRKKEEERQAKLDERADKEYEYGLQQRAKVDEALGGYEALQRGVVTEPAVWGGMPASADYGPTLEQPAMPTAEGGGALKTRKPTRAETVAARTRIALAQRDVKALGGLEAEGRDAQWGEDFNRYIKEYKGTDDQIGAAVQHINNNSSRVTLTDPDDKGVVRATVVKANGRADYVKLSGADQARLYAAGQMMETDPEKAYQIISSVNKTLGETMAQEAGYQFKAADYNEKGRHNSAVEARQAAQTAELSRHNMATERQGDARLGLERERVGIARGVANREKTSEKDKLLAQVDAYAGIIQRADPRVTPEEANRQAAKAILARGRGEKDDPMQTELTKLYVAEAAAAKNPTELTAIQNRYRSAGLERLGENPVMAALRAAQKPGAGDSPGKNPAEPKATPKTAILPRGGEKFGFLTSYERLQEAAAQGNADAKRELDRRNSSRDSMHMEDPLNSLSR